MIQFTPVITSPAHTLPLHTLSHSEHTHKLEKEKLYLSHTQYHSLTYSHALSTLLSPTILTEHIKNEFQFHTRLRISNHTLSCICILTQTRVLAPLHSLPLVSLSIPYLIS